MESIVALLSNYTLWLVGFILSLLAGLATGLGALVVLVVKKGKIKHPDMYLGFGAGVMLAATSFSLIVPGLESAGGGVKGALIIVVGMLLGGLAILVTDKYIPHEFFVKGRDPKNIMSLRRVWIFIIAITLHNFP